MDAALPRLEPYTCHRDFKDLRTELFDETTSSHRVQTPWHGSPLAVEQVQDGGKPLNANRHHRADVISGRGPLERRAVFAGAGVRKDHLKGVVEC
ncbi:hypothetical protein EVAR_27147_1 [Eumeta japonica]|uniref:Uncharacterized protein n=1 Tax=Eumeta variegata TaxID=151549 RepID=A0A4C1W0D9_EUMVA|nr:hypothetical protein EVAR_27147_1 [Eumeta japonica]